MLLLVVLAILAILAFGAMLAPATEIAADIDATTRFYTQHSVLS